MVAILIILCILVPVTSVATGFFVLKAVQLGLRWQTQIKNEQVPTMDAKEILPVVPVPKARDQPDLQTVIDEWLNGAPQERR